MLDYTTKASNVVCYPISLDLKPKEVSGVRGQTATEDI